MFYKCSFQIICIIVIMLGCILLLYWIPMVNIFFYEQMSVWGEYSKCGLDEAQVKQTSY